MLFQVLELICTREAGAVFEAGGLQCSLTFIREFGSSVHKDTLHSAMNVVSRLCGRMEPQDTNLETCVKSLSTLLKHEDPYVSVDLAVSCGLSLWFLRSYDVKQFTLYLCNTGTCKHSQDFASSVILPQQLTVFLACKTL